MPSLTMRLRPGRSGSSRTGAGSLEATRNRCWRSSPRGIVAAISILEPTPSMSLFPDPQRVRLDSLNEIAEATDRLLALAQRSIDVFEANLSDIEWGAKQRVEHLRRFLLASRTNRLRIVLRDIDVVSARQPRLMELLRLCSDRMEIRETGTDAERLA